MTTGGDNHTPQVTPVLPVTPGASVEGTRDSMLSAVRSLVEWNLQAGVTSWVGEVPQNMLDICASSDIGDEPAPVPARVRERPQPSVSEISRPSGAGEIGRAENLQELRSMLESAPGNVPLRATAKNIVFGDGNPRSALMVVGEAPGRDEDLQGKPFVGRSGQLLDRILQAIGRDRSTVYISNVLPYRPPGNRTPTLEEQAFFLPFLRRHINLVSPKILVPLGGAAAQAILALPTGIMRLRGRWKTGNIEGSEYPCLPTLHPAYLLRQSAHKRLAWEDWCRVAEKLAEYTD